MTIDANEEITILFEGVPVTFDPWQWWNKHCAAPTGNGNTYLVPKDIARIRRLLEKGISSRDVAREYGLSRRQVFRIKAREAYGLVEEADEYARDRAARFG